MTRTDYASRANPRTDWTETAHRLGEWIATAITAGMFAFIVYAWWV